MHVEGSAHHGFKGEAEMAAVLKGAQQLDTVTPVVWVCPRQLAEHHLHWNTQDEDAISVCDQEQAQLCHIALQDT